METPVEDWSNFKCQMKSRTSGAHPPKLCMRTPLMGTLILRLTLPPSLINQRMVRQHLLMNDESVFGDEDKETLSIAGDLTKPEKIQDKVFIFFINFKSVKCIVGSTIDGPSLQKCIALQNFDLVTSIQSYLEKKVRYNLCILRGGYRFYRAHGADLDPEENQR